MNDFFLPNSALILLEPPCLGPSADAVSDGEGGGTEDSKQPCYHGFDQPHRHILFSFELCQVF